MQKQSFGGGYGLNKNVGGSAAHGVAKPPMKNVTVKPGPGKQMPGSPKVKSFQGSKIYR